MGTNKNELLYFYLGFWYVQKDNSSLRKLSSIIRDPSWILQVFWILQESGVNLIYSTFNFVFESILTKEESRTDKPMDFTPEDEDEVIREAVSQKLDRPLVSPRKKFGETQIKLKLQL